MNSSKYNLKNVVGQLSHLSLPLTLLLKLYELDGGDYFI